LRKHKSCANFREHEEKTEGRERGRHGPQAKREAGRGAALGDCHECSAGAVGWAKERRRRKMTLLEMALNRPDEVDRDDIRQRLDLCELYLAWFNGRIGVYDLMRVLSISTSAAVRRDAADELKWMCSEGFISIQKNQAKWDEAIKRAAAKGNIAK
jgi:hypothetical protein